MTLLNTEIWSIIWIFTQYIYIILVVSLMLLHLYILYRLMGIKNIEIIPRKSGYTATVIIPVRNNPDGVKRIIESLCSSRHELIIVDDESTDDTYETALKLCDKCRCSVIRVSKPPNWMGKAYACWRGYQLSSNEYIIFIDSDTVVNIETIDTICTLLDNFDAVSLVPRIKPRTYVSALFEYAFTILVWIFYTPWRLNRPDRVWLAGAIMGWRRDSYQKLGGHRRVHNIVVEDVQLAQEAFKEGYKIGFYSLNTYYTEMNHHLDGLYEFMKRVSLFARVKPSLYLAIAILTIIMSLTAISTLITLPPYISILYIITLYLPPIYLYGKGYIVDKPLVIPLYPLSYILLSILGYRALKEINRSDGKIRIRWGGREVLVDPVNLSISSQDI